MIYRNVASFGATPDHYNPSGDHVEDVTIISMRAPLRKRLLGAWTAIFGQGLARLVSSWRSRNMRFTPTHWGR